MLFSACAEKLLYSYTVEFQNGTWEYDDPAIFEFEIGDITDYYNLFLDIDHSLEYPFENLYLRINTEFPDASSASDTLSIEMINNQGGWVGDCGSNVCDLTVFLQEKTKFKDTGTHKITIEQFTRESDLQGIRSLSFRVGYSID